MGMPMWRIVFSAVSVLLARFVVVASLAAHASDWASKVPNGLTVCMLLLMFVLATEGVL